MKVIHVFKAHQRGGALVPAVPAFAVPKTILEALRLAADLAEKVKSQQAQFVAQQPAVEFVDRHSKAETFLSLRDPAISLARAHAEGDREDLLAWVTHGRRPGIMAAYTTPPWAALCAEVAKLKLQPLGDTRGNCYGDAGEEYGT
ncbi:MAG: hypothetical protein EOO71_20025 [Myxococcaceae bacterium]|nr:MAG: hypothetical protein EOO71_20025 [Myxococcaceae bacterium]